ncbi:HlyD family type I secretion periplasmic adaptor subunit [Lichenicoccus roseus]|uniref:Membrane fusion protein (MFP) family protein n=1 Tax=Lichenicoccus roseus TaxID=2683649 RepID=A0A5R9J6Y1_9PROT|nr:HlyD family type I secretion periplasmic adaptor subunit [Lichenicoccus roseus]TLU73380.1 HlyD family type I secretion periplasmic adaptor subunit [Lichenicoccus roseus]
MASKDLVTAGGPVPGRPDSPKRPPRRRMREEELPQALLEFHSPSAALVAMPPLPVARWIIWIVGALAITMLTVMGTFPLDRVVTTPGELVSTARTMLVQPLETAIVKSIDVKEGEVVHKGQVLAHLDPTIAGADENNLRAQTYAYEAQVNRLQAEAAGTLFRADLANPASTAEAAAYMRRQAEFRAKLNNYTQQISALRSDVTGYQASAAMYAGRVKLAKDVRNMRVQLQRDQVGSRLSSLSAQDDLMEMQRSQVTAQENAAGARGKLSAMVAEQEGFVQNWKAQIYQDLSEAQHKYYEARGDLEKAVLRQSLVVMRAQADAVVLTIAKVSIGSVLSPATQFITLVPLDAPLEVEARLKGSDSGYVKLGDQALIKFATFPYTQYGGATATVRNVSADSFTKDQQQASQSQGGDSQGSAMPGGSPDTYYRIRLRVDGYTLHGVPNYFHPTPGMPVTADIKVGKRTILRYLLSSVLPVATEGMREP